MKIAVRGGHTELCTGAAALLNELTEDRKVKDSVIKYLKVLGHEVLDVTPPVNYTSSSSVDLSYGVNKANSWGAELFASFHFNKAYDSYNGAIGSEVCVYSEHETAQRVVDALGGLGFKNRGQKVRTGLYELKHTSMKSMIVETCFVEATEDVALYKKLGVDVIGKAIAEAISNSDIKTEVIQETPKSEPIKVVEESKPTGDDWIKRLQTECNAQGFSNQKVDGIAGVNTLNGCPTLRKGASGNITKLLQERLVSLRYSTNGIDGIYGSGTANAVYSYQKNKGLVSDGICGRATWSKLLGL